MKDPKDSKTIPLIPDPKLRGRPSTGSAMTAAQRKAEQRKRDRQLVTNENLTDATITALCEHLQHRVSMGDVDLVKGITLELMKRARLAFKNNVTVTKIKAPAQAKAKPVTVTKTKATEAPKSKPVTVTKNNVESIKLGHSIKPEVIKRKPRTTGESVKLQKAMAKRRASNQALLDLN